MPKILVVEDDLAVRELLCEMLESAGYEALCIADGEDAVRIARDSALDIVLTDIFMPRKDGLATIMELREALPALKIIAMSGGSQRVPLDMLKMARRLGAVATLQKPILCSELLAAVEDALGR